MASITSTLVLVITALPVLSMGVLSAVPLTATDFSSFYVLVSIFATGLLLTLRIPQSWFNPLQPHYNPHLRWSEGAWSVSSVVATVRTVVKDWFSIEYRALLLGLFATACAFTSGAGLLNTYVLWLADWGGHPTDAESFGPAVIGLGQLVCCFFTLPIGRWMDRHSPWWVVFVSLGPFILIGPIMWMVRPGPVAKVVEPLGVALVVMQSLSVQGMFLMVCAPHELSPFNLPPQ